MSQPTLPDDLLWEEGHASEIALTAIADGEEALLPRAAREHVGACAACTARLGEAALLSMRTSRALGELGPLLRLSPAPSPASATVRRRATLPLPMLAAALVVAALGAMPTLLQLPARFVALCVALTHMIPTLSHGGVQLLRTGLGPAWIALTCVSAVLLVMTSVVLTRLLPMPATR